MGGWFRTLALVVAAALPSLAASAQSGFPAKAVHILVPYPPGGGVDFLARTLGDELSRQWGQSVVVENRPGAGGVVASQALATSPPDGYTLIVVACGHATNPFLYAKLPYDTFKDFTPVSLLASCPTFCWCERILRTRLSPVCWPRPGKSPVVCPTAWRVTAPRRISLENC